MRFEKPSVNHLMAKASSHLIDERRMQQIRDTAQFPETLTGDLPGLRHDTSGTWVGFVDQGAPSRLMFISKAERFWAVESCNSRAMRRRSSSCKPSNLAESLSEFPLTQHPIADIAKAQS